MPGTRRGMAAAPWKYGVEFGLLFVFACFVWRTFRSIYLDLSKMDIESVIGCSCSPRLQRRHPLESESEVELMYVICPREPCTGESRGKYDGGARARLITA